MTSSGRIVISMAHFRQTIVKAPVKGILHTWCLKDIFLQQKKKQRKCITGSVLDVLLILKTLTFKSGIKGLKSYRTIRT